MLELFIDGDGVLLTGTIKGDENHRKLTTGAWKWSRSQGGYVLPRSLRPTTRATYIRVLRAEADLLGIPLEVEDTGVVQTEAERRAARTERLEQRLDRHEGAAGRHQAASDAAEAAGKAISDHIPMGQPVLLGHYSAPRHLRALARVHRLDEKAWAEQKAADRARELAEGLRAALTNPENPTTIRARIDRNSAEVRQIERNLASANPEHTDWIEMITAERDRLAESIELDQATLKAREDAGEFVTYSRENVAKGDFVNIRRLGWMRVVRANKTSVTVPSIVGGDWTDTIPYAKVIGHRAGADA